MSIGSPYVGASDISNRSVTSTVARCASYVTPERGSSRGSSRLRSDCPRGDRARKPWLVSSSATANRR